MAKKVELHWMTLIKSNRLISLKLIWSVYFKLIWSCKHRIWCYNFRFRKCVKLIWPFISGFWIAHHMVFLKDKLVTPDIFLICILAHMWSGVSVNTCKQSNIGWEALPCYCQRLTTAFIIFSGFLRWINWKASNFVHFLVNSETFSRDLKVMNAL